ncbi:MAG: transcriptional regulator GcvA [Verrucomicrobium sp.]|nr:transcriptional regulator GcvA [Verrucomicrobium sp.]
MNRQLPPLNALRAFETAARLESFSRAAEVLHVTHGAISRQIQLLEDWLGKPLFERRHRGVVLTEAGRVYLEGVSPAFDRIEAATTSQLAQKSRRVLRVNAPATFTLRWLIPRLADFHGKHPQLEIRLSSSNEEVGALSEPFDVVIRGGPRLWKGYQGHEFLNEHRLPVCSPKVLEKHRLKTVKDLRHHTFLHTASQPDAWSEWLALAEMPELKPAHTVTLDHFYLTLQAALDGVGVAMGPMILVAEDVESGRLVVPFDGPRLSTWHYFAYVPDALSEQTGVKTFLDWVRKAAVR